jgi:Rrf2 family nitric oxide-sensitive transcriptional repressor
MFSMTVEYALSAMTEIAREAPESSTTANIAASTGTPPAYLAKVLQALRRGRLITSRRGVGGGVALARPAKRISLLDVIDAVEPLKRGSNGKTTLSRKLDAMVSQARKTAAGTTLEDVAKGKR